MRSMRVVPERGIPRTRTGVPSSLAHCRVAVEEFGRESRDRWLSTRRSNSWRSNGESRRRIWLAASKCRMAARVVAQIVERLAGGEVERHAVALGDVARPRARDRIRATQRAVRLREPPRRNQTMVGGCSGRGASAIDRSKLEAASSKRPASFRTRPEDQVGLGTRRVACDELPLAVLRLRCVRSCTASGLGSAESAERRIGCQPPRPFRRPQPFSSRSSPCAEQEVRHAPVVPRSDSGASSIACR